MKLRLGSVRPAAETRKDITEAWYAVEMAKRTAYERGWQEGYAQACKDMNQSVRET